MSQGPHRRPTGSITVAALALAVTTVLASCSSTSGSSEGGSGNTTATVTVTVTAPAATASEAVDAESTAADGDAAARLQTLVAAMPEVSLVTVYDAASDPNDLLGRPGGYTSKVAFADSRVPAADVEFKDADAVERGGTVEVYDDAAAAQARSDYIQSILQGATLLGTEYHYLDGGALLRVTGVLTPDVAAQYEAVWSGAS